MFLEWCDFTYAYNWYKVKKNECTVEETKVEFKSEEFAPKRHIYSVFFLLIFCYL